MHDDWRDLPGPNWFSGADIYRRFVGGADGSAIAVELGAWKGRSACCMGAEIASSGKPIRFFAVDHWQGSEGEAAHDVDEDARAGRLYEVFLRNIEPVAAHVQPIRSDSVAAAGRFDEGSVDFLYVDASHTYDGVLGDLAAWYPKVKAGRLIAGDDWCFVTDGEREVRAAVLDFFRGKARRLVLENGSAPNENWKQWSIVKHASDRCPSLRALAWRRRLTRARLGTRRQLRKLLRRS